MGIDGGKQQLPSTELCEHDMSSYCKEMSSLLPNVCVVLFLAACFNFSFSLVFV